MQWYCWLGLVVLVITLGVALYKYQGRDLPDGYDPDWDD